MTKEKKFYTLGASLLVVFVLVGMFFAVADARAQEEPPNPPRVDHSEFGPLQEEFGTGPEVTAACLTCHADAGEDLLHTTHWTWEYTTDAGQELGKNNVINNYCVAVSSNWPRCTSCHIGYGYANADFDFEDPGNIDCLVCHDTTGAYKKFPAGSGHPTYETKMFPGGFGAPYAKQWDPVDLTAVAQSVGMPTRANCGSCHFNGGGAPGVKHGDLDPTMTNPSYELDVHMSPDGADMTCQTCHVTEDHNVAGSRYDMDFAGESVQTCASCHSDHAHTTEGIDNHTDVVACQTCHIPAVAREFPTKTWWDWSAAGELKDGEGEFEGKQVWLIRKDENGWKTYMSNKGEFEWAMNVQPEYFWFNGHTSYITLDDTFDPETVVPINVMHGDIEDETALIFPMKVFNAVQPYDAAANTLVVPNLFPTTPDAYWKTWDWSTAIAAGQASVGREFSGEVGWVETVMYWPLTHQVGPAETALQCESCHNAEGVLDFAALGYAEDKVAVLTTFPPVAPEPEVEEPVEEAVVEEEVVEEPAAEEAPAEEAAAEEPAASDSGSSPMIFWIALGVVVVLGGGAYFLRKK